MNLKDGEDVPEPNVYKDCKFLMLRCRAVSRCSEILITFAGKNTHMQINYIR